MTLTLSFPRLLQEELDAFTSSDFTQHSDHRQIAAFFLGWLFFYSFQCICRSQFIVNLVGRVFRRVIPLPRNARSVDYEKAAVKPPSPVDLYLEEVPIRGDNPTVRFAMYICFAFASLANFGSLVMFDPKGGDAACAFLVAWGGMAAELAKIVALCIIGLELRQLGVHKHESWAFWGVLGVIVVLIFVTTAIATGLVTVLGPMHAAFCNRRHFLPTAIITSLLEFFLGFYAVIRLITRITSSTYNVPNTISSIRDIRIIQVLAFLFLVLATLVPTAVATNLLGDFLPFTFGSLFVLMTFSFFASPLDDRETMPGGQILERSFSAHRGRSHPDLLGVYIPSSSSLRLSPINVFTRPDMSQHPYATAQAVSQEPLQRKSTMKSEPSSIYRFTYAESIADTDNAAENIPSNRRDTRHTLVKTQRTTPQATPTPSISSSVADVGEAPWRNSAWPAGASRKIVPHQVAYAAHLEKEDAALRKSLAMGPVPPPVRPMRPRVQIPGRKSSDLLAPEAMKRPDSVTPNSAAIYGSDIIRMTPSKQDRMRNKHVSWSPRSPDNSAINSAVTVSRSQTRHSLASTAMFLSPQADSNDAVSVATTTWFKTPPRTRRPTFGSVASETITTDVSTPAMSSGRMTGPRWRRPSTASVFSPGMHSAGISAISSTGETGANVELGGELAPGLRLNSIRGPRPPPATYQPGTTRFSGMYGLGAVREETPTPTPSKDLEAHR